MRCLRLPFTFEPGRLAADLALVQAGEWIPHQQRMHYDGRWSGAPLRSIAGAADNLLVDAREGQEFADTPLLARCVYFREVLGTFRCPVLAARLLRLHAGSSIAEHVDRALDFEDGEVRLHVPIVTSDEVRFYLDGMRLVMAPGECWYTNVNLPHSVENRGTTDRIHLVIDCVVDDWLRDIFATAPRTPRDHHVARIELPPGLPLGQVFADMNTVTARLQRPGRPVTFRVEGSELQVSWTGAHTWQARLRLAPAGHGVVDGGWTIQLESSPDPERTHTEDIDALCRGMQAAWPDTRIAAEAPA